ncbi:MAG: hypothetical protein MUC93_14110 [Bacteroidales bacterium]|nr:hypothetical protein [Bacteroidales bacterium]
MASKRLLYILALLLLISGSVFAQNKSPDEPWFFIQITDPQFGMFENNAFYMKRPLKK